MTPAVQNGPRTATDLLFGPGASVPEELARQIPAAALTAFAHSEDRKRALLAGFQTHIAKPVDPAELTAAIASLACRTATSDPHHGGHT